MDDSLLGIDNLLLRHVGRRLGGDAWLLGMEVGWHRVGA